jgi:hypothetical protein
MVSESGDRRENKKSKKSKKSNINKRRQFLINGKEQKFIYGMQECPFLDQEYTELVGFFNKLLVSRLHSVECK